MAVVKKIMALKDVTINTSQESREMGKGDVSLVRFGSEREYENMLALKTFQEYSGPAPKVVDLKRKKGSKVPEVSAEQPRERVTSTSVAMKEEESNSTSGSVAESGLCPKCNTELVSVDDDSTPGLVKTFDSCPSCGYERLVGERSEPVGEEVPEEDDMDSEMDEETYPEDEEDFEETEEEKKDEDDDW